MSDVLEPVSVVMPVLNEEQYLRQSVAHILGQDYRGPVELILALGPSRDASSEIARQIAAGDDRIRVVNNPSGKIACAINAAVQVARYQVIARVDGHALLPPDYLRMAVAALADTGAVNVGGMMAAAGESPFQQAVAWAMTSPFGVGASRFHTGGRSGPVDTVYLGVFRRKAIEQVGGYDEEYLRAEDWEMNHRIRQHGGQIWFQPDLRVTYRPRASARRLASQYFMYGRWRRVIARQHEGTINLRYAAPPAAATVITAGTVVGVAGLVALAVGAPGGWPAMLVMGFAAPLVYGAGILAVTAQAARRLPLNVASRLPLVLATMHMTWGIGFMTSPRSLVPANGRRPGESAEMGARPAPKSQGSRP